jgi:hypothetical protein
VLTDPTVREQQQQAFARIAQTFGEVRFGQAASRTVRATAGV